MTDIEIKQRAKEIGDSPAFGSYVHEGPTFRQQIAKDLYIANTGAFPDKVAAKKSIQQADIFLAELAKEGV